MDPLSTLLSLLKPQTYLAGRFDIGKRQAIAFPKYVGIKCYAVITGRCWLTVGRKPDRVELREGECFLLPHGLPFRLESELGGQEVELSTLVAAMQKGLTGLYKGKPAGTLAGGHFTFSGGPVDLLLGFLPVVVHLPKSAKTSAMRWTLERMREEILQQQLGSSFLVQQLAYFMLVETLRVHLTDAPTSSVGWLYALTDPQVRVAITSMHDRPDRAWTLDALARHIGMSRSLFARTFKMKVGESPIQHLTRWRMLLASDRLSGSQDSVLNIAASLGYNSESAFGKAFKRVTGYSPRQYRVSGVKQHV